MDAPTFDTEWTRKLNLPDRDVVEPATLTHEPPTERCKTTDRALLAGTDPVNETNSAAATTAGETFSDPATLTAATAHGTTNADGTTTTANDTTSTKARRNPTEIPPH